MTRNEWLASEDTHAMIRWLARDKMDTPYRVRDIVIEQKLILYGCACCRLIWDKITDPRGKRVVELAETFADNYIRDHVGDRKIVDRELDAAIAELYRISSSQIQAFSIKAAACAAQGNLGGVSTAQENAALVLTGLLPGRGTTPEKLRPAYRLFAPLVRDIFRYSETPLTVSAEWQTPAVRNGARFVYEERRWEDLPILADALEDAGCENDEMLNHLRGPGPHARGCWVLDKLLGKG